MTERKGVITFKGAPLTLAGNEVKVGDAAPDATMLAKDFRNLIHPGRAERLQTQATRGSAGQAIAALMLVIEDLSERQAKGEL